MYLKRSHNKTATLQQAGAPERTDRSGCSRVLELGTLLGGRWLTTEHWESRTREEGRVAGTGNTMKTMATWFLLLLVSDSRRIISEEVVCCS